MKLDTQQMNALAILTAIFPGDPVLDTALALAKNGDLPEVPTLTGAIDKRAEDAIKLLGSIANLGAVPGNPVKTKPAENPVVSDVATGSIRERILAFLRANPNSPAVSIKTAVCPDASGGGFAAALKVGLDKGQIVCQPDPDHAGKALYSLAPSK